MKWFYGGGAVRRERRNAKAGMVVARGGDAFSVAANGPEGGRQRAQSGQAAGPRGGREVAVRETRHYGITTVMNGNDHNHCQFDRIERQYRCRLLVRTG